MKHYHVIPDLDDEYVYLFYDFINRVSMDEDAVIHLYIDSNGGPTNIKDLIVSVVNQFEHEIYINEAQSASLEMVAELNGPVRLLPAAIGMYHLGSSNIPVRDGLRKNSLSKIREHFSNFEFNRTKSTMLKLKLTDDEIKRVLDHENVYFTKERLSEMFSDRL